MKKCKELSEVLAAEYKDQVKGRRTPKLEVHSVERKGEGYHCGYAGGILHLEAGNFLGQAYGISQMIPAVGAKHMGDFLGDIQPRFAFRPLWLGSRAEITVSENAGVYVPDFMLEEDALLLMPRICKRVIELGYNAIVLGAFAGSFLPKKRDRRIDLRKFMAALHEHGLKLAIKMNLFMPDTTNRPARCPLNPEYREWVMAACRGLLGEVPGVDYVLWESASLLPDFRQFKGAFEVTEYELVRDEVKLLEEALEDKAGLIFYLPSYDSVCASRQAAWMGALMDDMGRKTVLSFSAVSGGLFDDHREDHPVWKSLRESPDTSSTPLLPIANIGSIKQGEGLWPAPALDLIQRFYRRCLRHHFAGVMGVAGHLPKPGSLLDCQLWTAGQALWRDLPESLLMETWFAAYRPDVDFGVYREALMRGRETVLGLSNMRGMAADRDSSVIEESRFAMESIMAGLKQLKQHYDKLEKNKTRRSERPSLGEHFTYFARDVKNILLHRLQSCNIPAFNFLNGEDFGDSFWTQVSQMGPEGVRSDAKVRFLEEPQRGAPGSRMEMIFLESRLL